MAYCVQFDVLEIHVTPFLFCLAMHQQYLDYNGLLLSIYGTYDIQFDRDATLK